MYSFASEETYQDGEIIFKEGSSGDWVYAVISGSVEISKTVGGEKAVLAVLGQGEVFGELGFIGGIKRTATARAVGDTTLGVLDRFVMDKEFNNLSSAFRSILVAIVQRFQKMIDRANSFSSRSVTRIPETLSLSYKDGQSYIEAYTDNLSRGGLFIKTANPLEQGQKFLLKLQLPGLSDPMKIQCEVAWVRKQRTESMAGSEGMGVKFDEMDPKVKEKLDHYIQALMKE
jgi:uncharacterized protein (TIGR02266 family)